MAWKRPLSRHVANQRNTVLFGGRSLGSRRQAIPPRRTKKIALKTSRNDHSRGRPHVEAGGRWGSITPSAVHPTKLRLAWPLASSAHSASGKSVS